MYLCEPKTPSSGLPPYIAKVQSVPYPWHLHEELSALNLAPNLLTGQRQYPGGVEVIRMEYLDPAEGWTSLSSFSGDWNKVEELVLAAVTKLHSCEDGLAVHGDLNPRNVLLRWDSYLDAEGLIIHSLLELNVHLLLDADED